MFNIGINIALEKLATAKSIKLLAFRNLSKEYQTLSLPKPYRWTIYKFQQNQHQMKKNESTNVHWNRVLRHIETKLNC